MLVQFDLQLVPPHTYAPHDDAVTEEQVPRPLQYAVGVALPLVQLAAAHTVEVPGGEPHAMRLLPSQLAWHVPVPVHDVRVVTPLWGAPTTGMHWPTLPPTSHASHWPVHDVLQHTPSTQLPEPHSVPSEHAVPFGLLHVPAVLALHLSGEVHDAVLQHTPSTQLPLEHWPDEVQTVPSAPVVTQLDPLQK
jgi:hypothetical protein